MSGREVYSWHPGGALQSSQLAKLLSKTGVSGAGTNRNWRTGRRSCSSSPTRPWRDLVVEVAERDHEIQDPTSAEKIRLLGEYLRLDGSSRVLDLAWEGGPRSCSRRRSAAGSRASSCRPQFADDARARVAERGLGGLVSIESADAAALCCRARVCGRGALSWCQLRLGAHRRRRELLGPAFRPGGFVAIGEPFWRQADAGDASVSSTS